MWCETEIAGKQFLICSVYIPTKHTNDLHKLNEKLHSIEYKQPLLIGGDFNARNQLWDPQLNPSGDAAWKMGDLLLDIIFDHNLKIHNNGTPTFFRKEYVSALDITLSTNFSGEIKWLTDINSILQTDHYGIIIDIPEKNNVNRTEKWDLGNTDWNLWNTELKKFMEDWLISLPPNVTPYEACVSYTDTILECAEKTIPKKIICKHSKPFMNKHLKSLRNNIRKLRKVHHKRSDPNN